MLLGPVRLPGDPAAATARSMDAVIRWLGTSIQVTAFAGDAAAVRATLAAAARLTDLITADLVTLDERTADVRILQGASNVTSTVTHRLVYSITGFETFLVYWDAPNGGFTRPGVTPWLPLGDTAARNVADQRHDPTSILTLTHDLLALRRRTPDLHSGSYASLPAPDGAWAWRRGAPGPSQGS